MVIVKNIEIPVEKRSIEGLAEIIRENGPSNITVKIYAYTVILIYYNDFSSQGCKIRKEGATAYFRAFYREQSGTPDYFSGATGTYSDFFNTSSGLIISLVMVYSDNFFFIGRDTVPGVLMIRAKDYLTDTPFLISYHISSGSYNPVIENYDASNYSPIDCINFTGIDIVSTGYRAIPIFFRFGDRTSNTCVYAGYLKQDEFELFYVGNGITYPPTGYFRVGSSLFYGFPRSLHSSKLSLAALVE